jgi:dolichol-phosphate mannosyltransferase
MIEFWLNALAWVLLLVQLPTLAILLARLLPGALRRSPLQPCASVPANLGSVSVIVPTLNEASRISPCLKGLSQQSYEVREIIVVDSYSQDGTPDLVKAAAERDPRFRLINDSPLPGDWVGRPWALHSGYLASSEQSQWILGIDADTQPQPSLVSSLLAVSEEYDLITLSPRFILKHPGEWWLQPALLMTLLYRFGASGDRTALPERVMANGQCFFCRRSVLQSVNGYTSARSSFCDDVTLARHIATHGFRVGFLDGSQVFKVRMYDSMAETWKEWGRSLDLKDASTPSQVWGDWLFLVLVQGLPLLLTLALLPIVASGQTSLTLWSVFALNLGLVLTRLGLNAAVLNSYDFSQSAYGWLFWLSPLADPVAVVRILLSSLRTPKQWRGRSYGA